MFLIDIEDIDRLRDVPRLDEYLQHLAERCETEPRAGVVVEGAGVDLSSARVLEQWDPAPRVTAPAHSVLSPTQT